MHWETLPGACGTLSLQGLAKGAMLRSSSPFNIERQPIRLLADLPAHWS
jgi:hypothetical protein